MPELKSWGVVWTEAISYFAGWRCENPSCSWGLPDYGEKYKCIVGFVCEPPYQDVARLIVGKVIFECPKCFENFWLHFNDDLARRAMRYCPNWPK